MAIFGPKPWVNPFGKMSIFRLFKLFVFIAWKCVFSFQNMLKRHFPSLYFSKNKLRKIAIFEPKRWVNPFEKMSIFRLFEPLVLIAQKGFFFVLQYRKRHFPCLYCLKKNNLEKWPFLDQNHGFTPLEKCQFFDFFNFFFLQPRNGFFRSRIS